MDAEHDLERSQRDERAQMSQKIRRLTSHSGRKVADAFCAVRVPMPSITANPGSVNWPAPCGSSVPRWTSATA